MAVFNKVNVFIGDLGKKVHHLDTDAIRIYLSNTAPVATNAVKADVAEIGTGNGYTGPVDVSGVWTQQGATTTWQLASTDVVITASGGTVGPFRYVLLYNDTPTSPADPLIGWWDYGSAVTLQDAETFTVDFGVTTLTIG